MYCPHAAFIPLGGDERAGVVSDGPRARSRLCGHVRRAVRRACTSRLPFALVSAGAPAEFASPRAGSGTPAEEGSPPLPDDRDHAWLAVAFPLIARALALPDPNPVTIATCGYVDSTVGHIDGQYLFAQVALEATAYRLTPDDKPVVKDITAWKAWAKAQRSA